MHIESFFTLGRPIGGGGGGGAAVRQCTRRRTGEHYACKSAPKSDYAAVSLLRAEIETLEKLRSEEKSNKKDLPSNIIKMVDYFEDTHSVHVITELCTGGDLFEHFIRRRPHLHMTESEAAQAFYAAASAVHACHRHGVAHRDIKMENLLLPTPECSYSEIKLADFGLSEDFWYCRRFHDVVGSPMYMAPEVFERSYDERVDIWSLGVLLYFLLSARPPFHGETVHEVYLSAHHGKLDFESEPWPGLSLEVKDLIRSMLQPDPKDRAKLSDILNNPWLLKHKMRD